MVLITNYYFDSQKSKTSLRYQVLALMCRLVAVFVEGPAAGARARVLASTWRLFPKKKVDVSKQKINCLQFSLLPSNFITKNYFLNFQFFLKAPLLFNFSNFLFLICITR